MELYKKYRPAKLSEVVGQDAVIKSINKMLSNGGVPHAMMFAGPSGVGKTTVARVLKAELDCGDPDFIELNCADFRGIDLVRDIRSTVRLSPLSGKSRIWLIDEAHSLTKDAQNGFLKLLEDVPAHAYFFLATTEPDRLLPTVRTRCTPVMLKPLTPKQTESLLRSVLARENAKVSQDVLDSVVTACDGSARKALVLLEQALSLDDEDEQLAAVGKGSVEHETNEICLALLRNAPWANVAKMLRAVEAAEEPETTRRKMLGYFNSVLLAGGKNAKRAAHVIGCLRDNVYDSGKAGLTLAAWEACND